MSNWLLSQTRGVAGLHQIPPQHGHLIFEACQRRTREQFNPGTCLSCIPAGAPAETIMPSSMRTPPQPRCQSGAKAMRAARPPETGSTPARPEASKASAKGTRQSIQAGFSFRSLFHPLKVVDVLSKQRQCGHQNTVMLVSQPRRLNLSSLSSFLQAGQIGHSFSVASVNATLAAIVFDG